MTAAGRVLVVSPIPTEPRDQGNAARIATVCEMLQAAGWIVHFLYHKLEGLTPAQAAAMAAAWDHVHTMDGPPAPTPPATETPHGLDDWADPRLAEFARALHRRWRFAVVVVNYVWCSAVLEAFDGGVTRVLDTHDVFGGRAQRFRELGLPPAWFHTTEAEEARGLARADIVLAIQEEEARIFRARGHADVRVIGHLLPCLRRPVRMAAGERPRAGYLASGNPLNVAAFEQMRAAARRRRGGDRICAWVLAGPICDRVIDSAPFVALGRVERTDAFYDAVDIVLNPMPGGTGLKIKSVEAVHRGLPLVATRASMIGVPAMHPAHCLDAPEEVVAYLRNARWTPALLAELHVASEACAREYAEGTRHQFGRFLVDLAKGTTAMDGWDKRSFRDLR